MKQILTCIFTLLLVTSYTQEFSTTIFDDYDKAVKQALHEKKPLFIYLGKPRNNFSESVRKNDTLTTVLAKEYINVLSPRGKDRRQLRRKYDAKKTSVLVLNHKEQALQHVRTESIPEILTILEPLHTETFYFFSKEYKDRFIDTESVKIFDEISNAYAKSSRKNARELAIAYLKAQGSLLTPTNYQLFKTLLPIGDEELMNRFLKEMRPEMYTKEMAEKLVYELLLVNDFSTDVTRKQIETYGIPFQEEMNLYLSVYGSQSGKDKKENCYAFVLKGTTFDFESLSTCFQYVLHNGNEKQIHEMKQKYIITMNEGSLTRTLLYADLLGQIFLKQGDFNMFLALQKRNKHIREKYMVNYTIPQQ